MFDVILRNDLLNLNKVDNINDLSFNRKEMRKIIKCRTADKISLLNYLLSYNVIDDDCYRELLQRTESDCRKANLYLLGLYNI